MLYELLIRHVSSSMTVNKTFQTSMVSKKTAYMHTHAETPISSIPDLYESLEYVLS